MPRKKRSADSAEDGADFIPLESASKKAKFFDESESEDDFVPEAGLTINQEFAQRFEHNKKRAELHRLEEKYGKSSNGHAAVESESESSTDEDEDDAGEFVTEGVDAEIDATLKAIRSKDPRVYDQNTRFFTEIDESAEPSSTKAPRPQSMTLKEYHRKNLLEGNGVNEEDSEARVPYVRQQAALKRSLVGEMHAAADEASSDDEADEAAFLRPVKRPSPAPAADVPDVALAERDPETFLSNFLASRAWVPTDVSKFAPLESDDEEDEVRAEAFEQFYNLRFEDPALANKKLISYARDAVAARTVRREDKSTRKRARDKDRERKEAEKQERDVERSQLRKLKLEEMEDKVKRIREAAGASGKDFKIEDWVGVLEADWDDDQWDTAMQHRFGDSYYQKDEGLADGSDEEAEPGITKSKKPKKPQWDDDIDIGDLVPDFEDEDEINSQIQLTEEEDNVDPDAADVADEPLKKKNHKKAKAEAKAASRRDQRILSALVDQNLPLSTAQPGSKTASAFAPFRYRETSPNAFGLTSLDILGATDAQLNEFAGLKKLAAFRDPERKRRDRKKLGKKARLRQWRRDTFGDEEGPDAKSIFNAAESANAVPVAAGAHDEEEESNIRGAEGERKTRKKKRGKKGKGLQA